MSSGLILKMNSCCKGVSRELEKFAFYRPRRGPLTMVQLLYNQG
jgi:hypothetical protein